MRCRFTIICFFSISFLTISCKKQSSIPESDNTPEDLSVGMSDFEAFYDRFHVDSAFQMEHTIWPLQGNYQQTEQGELVDVKWTPEDWILHQPMNLGNDFVREIEVLSDGFLIETIRAKAGNYSIVRRFSKLGDEWNLIYYQEALLKNDASDAEDASSEE